MCSCCKRCNCCKRINCCEMHNKANNNRGRYTYSDLQEEYYNYLKERTYMELASESNICNDSLWD